MFISHVVVFNSLIYTTLVSAPESVRISLVSYLRRDRKIHDKPQVCRPGNFGDVLISSSVLFHLFMHIDLGQSLCTIGHILRDIILLWCIGEMLTGARFVSRYKHSLDSFNDRFTVVLKLL